MTNDDVLQRLDITEQELKNEILLILEASDDEFEIMMAPHKDAIDRISKRMMSPDEMIKAGRDRNL